MDFLMQDASHTPMWLLLLALVPAALFSLIRSANNRRVEEVERRQLERRASIARDMAEIYGGKKGR